MIASPAAATWDTTLGQLEMAVTRANYETWLRDTVGLRQDEGRFIVGAHSDFATEWLGTRLRPLIAKTLAGVVGQPVDVDFEVLRIEQEPPPLLPPARDGAAPEGQPRRGAVRPKLNAVMTFDAFVVGDENRMAYEAARRAATEPGALDNSPLLIFGKTGIGKTHLLHAIAHEAYERGLSVVCVPAEHFGNDYNGARESNGWEMFRRRYRSADVLLIDDIQFFEGKVKFQEDFFHTFNDLHTDGKQIVMTVDRAPSELGGIMERLRSRLHWGLVADMTMPGFGTRLAILRAKAARHAFRLPEEALRIIAERCCPTVRELEGYLHRLLRHGQAGGELTPAAIEGALSPFATPAQEREVPPAETIVRAVCAHKGVQPGGLCGKSRARDLTYVRHLAMYLLKADAHLSWAEIGRRLGDRNHATVIAGVHRIENALWHPETSADVRAVREGLAAAG